MLAISRVLRLQLGLALTHRDGVQVDDAVDAVVGLLQGDVVADGAQVVAQVQGAGGLGAAKTRGRRGVGAAPPADVSRPPVACLSSSMVTRPKSSTAPRAWRGGRLANGIGCPFGRPLLDCVHATTVRKPD